MSDLASLSRLARSNAQLPVGVYFDDTLLNQEIRQLFNQGPQYVGHELMVPNVGDYASLMWENDGRLLTRDAQGIQCLSTSTSKNADRSRQLKQHHLSTASLDL